MGNKITDSSALSLLLALKKNVMKDLKVAEIGIVTKIDSNGIQCSLLNTQQGYIICQKLKDLIISENDKVLILFTDTDFRQSKAQESETLHNINYGIVIGIIE